MGTIQQSVNQMLGTAQSITRGLVKKNDVSEDIMAQTQQRIESQKLAKAKQRASLEKQRAIYAKSKLQKEQANLKLKELKGGTDESITIGGQKITDPQLLKKLKEHMNNGK